jgi:dethiobiotin synthetase
LFITATDTGVGKTVIACAIAAALRTQGSPKPYRIGVCKPFASGCRRDREGLVSEDAEALAHFADCRQPLETITPIRFADPLAPAPAAERLKKKIDYPALARSLQLLDDASDALIVEGIGGLLVPLDPRKPSLTVLDLIKALGLPTVVVTRATLGTLNHTAMTVRLLEKARCPIAGIVINGYDPDSPRQGRDEDLAMTTNRVWIEKMNRAPVLATVPRCEVGSVHAGKGMIPAAILDAVAQAYWPDVLGLGA